MCSRYALAFPALRTTGPTQGRLDRAPERFDRAERAARDPAAERRGGALVAADRRDAEGPVAARERVDDEPLTALAAARAQRSRLARIAPMRRHRIEQRVDARAVARRDEQHGRLPAL